MEEALCKSTAATRSWCKSLPKSELHAHLSGCISKDKIREILRRPENEKLRAKANSLFSPRTSLNLKECFELFPIIHEIINSPAILREVVFSVLDDFAADNVIYLELRTTPRSSDAFTPRLYLSTVLQAVDSYHKEHPNGLLCRVLVSISRHLPVQNARETMKITEDIMRESAGTTRAGLIVGLELSGNPHRGSWDEFKPVFEDARRRLHLPISLHFGEVLDDKEANAMLDFRPSRLGHAVVLSDAVATRMITEERNIGVEVCISSNLMTESVTSLHEHPVVKKLLGSRHPFSLCTDDPGILETTLSEEYAHLSECVALSRERVSSIALKGLQLSFCRDENVLESLYRTFSRKLQQACCGENATECALADIIDRRIPVPQPLRS